MLLWRSSSVRRKKGSNMDRLEVKRKKGPTANELRAAMRPTPAALAAARALGALGGATAAKNMSASARRERAKRAALARWSKSKRPK
jgi:hypothetical protein